MKNILLPFGIVSITGTNFYAVKLTANISKSDEVNLTDRYGVNVCPISRKDGKKSKAVKLIGVLNKEKVWDFLNELRLAVIDRKIGDLYDARLAIIKGKHAEKNQQEKENFVENPYAMAADDKHHATIYNEDTPLVGYSVNYDVCNDGGPVDDDKPAHVVGFIDLSKQPSPMDEDIFDDDELPW